MTKKIQKTEPAQAVKQFIETFVNRLNGIEESCRELAALVDANPNMNVFDEITAADSRFNYNMLESMRKVGKGELYCELLFDSSAAARRLLLLPPAQQKKLYNEPIKIVKIVGGTKVVEEKTFRDLSRRDFDLVIDSRKGRARTVDEQLVFVKPQARARSAERFEIKDDKLIVMSDTEFTMTQLEEILERMKAKAIESLATVKTGK